MVDTIEKIKAISFDSTSLDAYVSSLRGLSETQARVVLSSAGLDKAQKQQILNKLAETSATVSLTSAEATAALTKSLGSKAEAEALLVKAGLVTQEQLLAGVTIETSAAQLAALAVENGLTQADVAKISSALGLTGANVGLGASFKLLAASILESVKAMAAWLFTTPVGWATLAIGAIVGAIAAYNKWGDTLENNRKKLEELKIEAQTISSDLQALNNELQQTQQRISELEGKDSLTLTEAEELNNLRKQNNELQRSIDLLKLKEKENNKGKNETFVKTMQKNVDVKDEKVQTGRLNPNDTAETETITEAELIKRKFETLGELQEKLRQASTEKEQKAIQEQIDKITKFLTDRNEEYIKDAEGIDYIQNPTAEDDKKVNEWLDYINDFQDKMAIAMGGDNARENAFNRLVDNWKFDELLNPLQKLGKEGKVTAEMLNDPKYDAFIQKLIDIEFISDDTEGSLRFVASAFNGTMQSAQKYVTSLKGDDLDNFVENLGEEAKALGTTESELAKLTAAHVIFNNTELSTEQQQRVLQQLAAKIATTSEEMKYLLKLFNIAAMDSVDELMAKGMTRHEAIRRIGSVREYLKDKYGIDLSPITIPEKEDDDPPPYTSPGDKDKTNEALDNYLKNAENRYKIHQDETKYIQELQYAYDNLTKDEKERLDITGKINEAYRNLADNRIKDIEHQIDLAKELNEYADVTEYYKQVQKIAHEEANRLRSMGYDDNSNEIQELQKTWWDAQKSIADWSYSNSERWIDERNTYNDWELYGDNEIAAWERVLKRFKTEFSNELEKIKDIEQKIFEARKEAMEKSIDDIEDYIDARNHYNDWEAYGDSELKAVQRQTKIIEDAYKQRLLSSEEYIEKLEEQTQRIYSLAQDEIDKSLSNIDNYIDARNHYGDWDDFNDTEINAIKRQCKILDDAYALNLMSLEDYTEKSEEYAQKLHSVGQEYIDKSLSEIDRYISARNAYDDWGDWGDSEIEAIQRQIDILDIAYKEKLLSLEEYTKRVDEYSQKLYSVAKNNIIKTISELVEDYEKMRQDEKDALSFEASQYNSLKTLLQSYYDVTNSISEAQHEINKELKASQSMYEYLNEETRELLFNQEDYEALSEKLLEIQLTANELQEQYNNDILNASEETIAEITSQYQMQYETMMKQYELAKAELDIAKKRQKLDNVLAERNVRMFIGGQWQWVADTQKIIEAQNELDEAKIKKEQQETSLKQIDSINKLTEAQDDITTQINYLETDLEKIRDKWSEMQKMLDGESHEVAEALRQISEVSSPELQRVIEETGGNVASFSTSLSESIDAMATVINTNLDKATSDILDNVVKGVEDVTSAISDGVGDFVTDLQKYSDAIKNLVNKINDFDDYDDDDYDDNKQSSTNDIIAEMKANSAAWHTASESEKKALEERNQYLGGLIGAKYDSATGTWTYPTTSSSSSSGSSPSSSGGKVVQAGSDGNAPSGTKVGDTVQTAGGNYLVVPHGTPGSSYNPASGLSSIKIDDKNANGTRYTSGGVTLMGEEGFEAFIRNDGRLIPIDRPTIGNIGAGGIVFNREQMANLRNLWDLSNLGKVSPFVSSSNASNQNTVIDNSIHINGLTVGEQGNEDWINGLRRYVATHK